MSLLKNAYDPISLLDLTVDHCQTPAVTLPSREDLFKCAGYLVRPFSREIVCIYYFSLNQQSVSEVCG